MSEPMSSGEIEDVLSSIRRLVSEDDRPVARPSVERASGGPSATAAAEAAPTGNGALLLTPAFRVVGAENGPKPHRAAQEKAAFTRSVTEDEQDRSVDATDVIPASNADDDDHFPEETDVHIESDTEFSDWKSQADGADECQFEAANETPEMNRIVSEIGAGVRDEEAEWEPETGDVPVSTLSWKAPEWVEEAEVVEDSLEAQQRDAVAKALADKAEAAALAEIAARAAAAAGAAAQDGQGKAQADVKSGTEAESDADEDMFAADEGHFDETVLRDLVRDLIREELSGALGERITRNVRKLVRAEINRALTARDFD